MNKTVTRRILLNGFLALALVPCLAQAQRTIPVEVVNTSAAPMPVVVQSGCDNGGTPQRQLVGFTSATAQADIGVPFLNDACVAEFPDSRMCTSAEINNSPQLPPNSRGQGLSWVRPSNTTLLLGNSGLIVYDKVSGISSSGTSLNCRGFTSGNPNDEGMVVTVRGQFTFADCETFRHVACCAPVQ